MRERLRRLNLFFQTMIARIVPSAGWYSWNVYCPPESFTDQGQIIGNPMVRLLGTGFSKYKPKDAWGITIDELLEMIEHPIDSSIVISLEEEWVFSFFKPK